MAEYERAGDGVIKFIAQFWFRRKMNNRPQLSPLLNSNGDVKNVKRSSYHTAFPFSHIHPPCRAHGVIRRPLSSTAAEPGAHLDDEDMPEPFDLTPTITSRDLPNHSHTSISPPATTVAGRKALKPSDSASSPELQS